jgi:hypothetical protein
MLGWERVRGYIVLHDVRIAVTPPDIVKAVSGRSANAAGIPSQKRRRVGEQRGVLSYML